MSRDWKPGDVAMADGCRMMRTQSGWLYASPGSLVNYTHAEGSSADHVTALARPLVVIDPEDVEQVERLADLLAWALHTNDTPRLADALREFADPKPRIEEPTGLGAVVRDVEGILWTRVEAGEAQTRNPWYPADAADFQPDGWHNLCAVEVLSEGVTE